jgi:serine/threonine protein kinase
LYPEELGFTKLSADLLSRMLEYKELNRFNADQCLKHPWITRQNYSKVPETVVELHQTIECEEMLKKIQNTVMFLSIMQKPKSVPEEYKSSKPF